VIAILSLWTNQSVYYEVLDCVSVNFARPKFKIEEEPSSLWLSHQLFKKLFLKVSSQGLLLFRSEF
jgi:hypothetical protein